MKRKEQIETQDAMIQLDHVSKCFHGHGGSVHALNDISLHVEKGDIYGIIGASGAGKSTLIRMVNRLEQPDSGSVTVDGQNIGALSKATLNQVRRKIGMIFQQFNLLESKTVFDNVAMPLVLSGASKDIIKRRVTELLRFVELDNKTGFHVGKLSGGQKQRVGIARALATEPSILLCDEATSALDPMTTLAILKLLKKINREMGVTILLITHQMQVIQMVCNKVAVMAEGAIIEYGDTSEIFGAPKEEVTKEFVRMVLNDQIPEGVREIVQSERRNYRIERLRFMGSAVKAPVISSLCKNTKAEVNILCATVLEMRDSVICLFILQLTGEDADITQAEQEIDAQEIFRERIELT